MLTNLVAPFSDIQQMKHFCKFPLLAHHFLNLSLHSDQVATVQLQNVNHTVSRYTGGNPIVSNRILLWGFRMKMLSNLPDVHKVTYTTGSLGSFWQRHMK